MEILRGLGVPSQESVILCFPVSIVGDGGWANRVIYVTGLTLGSVQVYTGRSQSGSEMVRVMMKLLSMF